MNQLATRPDTQIEAKRDIRDFLQSDNVLNQVSLALPRHMSADRLMRVMLTGLNRTPKLLECTRESILESLMTASQMGLEPDGRNGHLIPFSVKVDGRYVQQCKFMPDYKGLVALVRRSGDVKNIHCAVVYSNDEFDYEFGSQQRLRHKPALVDRGAPIAVYSLVTLKDGAETFEVLSVEDVNKVRDNSKGYKDAIKYKNDTHPWISAWDEMAKKTAFKRHSKWLPLSYEVQRAVEVDNDADAWEDAGPATGFMRPAEAVPEDKPKRGSAPAKNKGVASVIQEAERAVAAPAVAAEESVAVEAEVVDQDSELDFAEAEQEPAPAPGPEPEPRRSLEGGEKLQCFVEVTSIGDVSAGGKPGKLLSVTGEYEGQKILTFILDNWAIGQRYNVVIEGKLNRKDGSIIPLILTAEKI